MRVSAKCRRATSRKEEQRSVVTREVVTDLSDTGRLIAGKHEEGSPWWVVVGRMLVAAVRSSLVADCGRCRPNDTDWKQPNWTLTLD